MEKDKGITKVVFRKLKETNEIIALFPELIEKNYYVLSYMHVGQHGSADYNHIVNISKLATENEYKDLFNELTNIGYNLQVLKRAKINYSNK